MTAFFTIRSVMKSQRILKFRISVATTNFQQSVSLLSQGKLTEIADGIFKEKQIWEK